MHGDCIYSDIINLDNIEELTNEQLVNTKRSFRVNKLGDLKVEVYSNEGNIPHFHIYNKDKSFDTCICIYSPNYFAHGGKYRDTFNSRQLDELNKWLDDNNNNYENFNNWQTIEYMFNSYNPNCRFPVELKCKFRPDYTRTVNFKEE